MPRLKTALIIDDDSDYRHFLEELLRGQAWRVLSAAEGDEGVALAQAERPDLVICDLLMARVNGFQVCRALRRLDALKNTRIVISSGRHFVSDRQEALAAGADDYFTKPLHLQELAALLARLTEAEPGAQTQSAGPLSSAPTRVRFWGVRGSIPTPGPSTVRYGGNTSCVEVRAQGQIIILDAGTGLRPLGRQLVAEFDTQPLALTLLLTHTHWDHIQGLPFFLPVYQSQNHLRILGFEGARLGLEHVLAGQMESTFFPIGLREVPANVRVEELKDLEFNVGPVRVQAAFANHPGICVGYRLFAADGSVAFFPDNEPYHPRPLHASPGDAGSTAADQFAFNQEQKMVEFLRGADVLIIDAQYDAAEYQQHIGWGHGCVDDVVALALKSEVKKLFLFHHDPDHDDDQISAMVAHARHLVAQARGTLHVDAAQEGAVVELPRN